MTQKKRMAASKRADQLFSTYIRQRDGACQRCGSTEWLQCAHIVSRRYRAVRWSPDNAIALCRACHTWQTHHPLEGNEWFRSKGYMLDALQVAALKNQAMDPEFVCAWLKKAMA